MYAVYFYLTLDRTQSGAATPNQSGPRNDDDEGVLYILHYHH